MTEPKTGEENKLNPTQNRSWNFWLLFCSLCLVSFLSALDGSILTTALPTVTSAIGGEAQYVWIANSFVLAQTVVQPLFAQISDLFGRRWPMIVSVALFALGSGIAGGSSNVAMLIAGRTVQGLGSGGIFMLTDLIVCDLVSQRERGKYLGITLSTASIGAIMGPVIGGAIAEADWRWVFYINLPISGVVLSVVILFLRLKVPKQTSLWTAMLHVDWIGSILFISSMCSLLIGLILGGVMFPWSSWRIILPLALGGFGWIGFHAFETSGFCRTPIIPSQLFTSRNAAIGFFLAFIAAMLLRWVVFYLPIYFQGVRGTTPLTSGVDILPYNSFLIPAAILAGAVMSKFGFYRSIHAIGFGLIALGSGLQVLLRKDSGVVLWVIFQLLIAVGEGLLIPTILPAIQAALPTSLLASSTGMYAFLRSFAFVWGVTLPGIIFNGQFDRYSSGIDNPEMRQTLTDGRAYGFASQVHSSSLSPEEKMQIATVYTKALNTVWEVAVAFALLGLCLSLGQRYVELKKHADSEYGLALKEKGQNPGEVVSSSAKDIDQA